MGTLTEYHDNEGPVLLHLGGERVPASPGGATATLAPGVPLTNEHRQAILHFSRSRKWLPLSRAGIVNQFGFFEQRHGYRMVVYEDRDRARYERFVVAAMHYWHAMLDESGHGELKT